MHRKSFASSATTQRNLFSGEPSTEECERARCTAELRAAINQAIREYQGGDRHHIAAQMSRLLGEDVSKSQLDSWTSESKSDHHIPAEYLVALCLATNSTRPIATLVIALGCGMVAPDEHGVLELARIRRRRLQLEREERELQMRLDKVGLDREGRR